MNLDKLPNSRFTTTQLYCKQGKNPTAEPSVYQFGVMEFKYSQHCPLYDLQMESRVPAMRAKYYVIFITPLLQEKNKLTVNNITVSILIWNEN